MDLELAVSPRCRGRRLLAATASLCVCGIAGAQIASPTLKWERGGCTSFCNTGWYSSPAVADLDGDGHPEVIAASYTVWVLNGENGAVVWDDPAPGRTWAGVIVADLDNDGALEIATGHSDGWVSVYKANGDLEPGWPWQIPIGGEVRSLTAADLDGDGDLELLVGRASGGAMNVWALEHTGVVRAGWPQLTGQDGYAAGIYNANIGAADLDGDGDEEVFVPSDVHYICAYDGNGGGLPTNPIFGNRDRWGEVGAYTLLAWEMQGFGPCGEEYTTRGNFASGAATIADMDGDGTLEIAVVGNVHDCHTDPYTDVFMGPFLFNVDRTRFVRGAFDWSVVPIDTGAPLSEDYNVIENVQQNSVVADLDGDGRKEFLFPSYDGRLHCYWLDKTEHGNWPFELYSTPKDVFRFPSEPAVADLDGDRLAEVIFASWAQKNTGLTGFLHIVSANGDALHEIPLPPDANWNGALACPTLANIDADPDLEVVLMTAASGVVAYDLPGTANARILWRTGRGSYLRDGVAASAGAPATGVLVH